jgi:hypothetical protein
VRDRSPWAPAGKDEWGTRSSLPECVNLSYLCVWSYGELDRGDGFEKEILRWVVHARQEGDDSL